MNAEDIQKIVTLLGERIGGDKKHATADCNLVISEKEQGPNKALFLYGVAHLLKHHCRELSYEIMDKMQPQCADTKIKRNIEEAREELIRAIGWADEFYWLSMWGITGKLTGSPRPEETDHSEVLFLAFAHVEWCDFLLEIRRYLQVNIINRDALSTESQWGVFSFAKDEVPETKLLNRAESRRMSAAVNIEYIEMNSFSDDVYETLKMRLILRAGRAKIRVLAVKGDFENAKKECQRLISDNRIERFELIRLKKIFLCLEAKTNIDEFFSDTHRTTEKSLVSLHILAGWIEDLLLIDGKPLHTRLYLHRIPGYKETTGPSSIPLMHVIEELKERLHRNIWWLEFLSKDAKDHKDKLNKIAERADYFKYRKSKTSSSSSENISPGSLPKTSWRLHVLRDWGSFTPILSEAQRIKGYKRGLVDLGGGGGYFLQIFGRKKKIGIVIDPGYDFIKHFHDADLDSNLITHVVVTHDHYDHEVSFGPLLNLIYAQRCHDNPKRKVDFLLNRGTLDHYARFIVDMGLFGKIEPITDEDGRMGRCHELDHGIHLVTTHTAHGKSNGFGKGVGLIFSFPNSDLPAMGITSDTGWYENYQDIPAMQQQQPSNFDLGNIFSRQEKPKVMVLHVGSLKQEELYDSGFYKDHLGARGVFRCIEGIESCQLALLSEFGEECRGYREWFSTKVMDFFQKKNRPNFRCFPSDRHTIVEAQNGRLSMKLTDLKQFIPYNEVVVREEKGRLIWRKSPKKA